MQFSSPNLVLWKLRAILERFALSNDNNSNEELIEQNGLLSVIVGATLVETFTNAFFRVVASEPKFSHAREKILSELSSNKADTKEKLKEWSQEAFGKKVDTADKRWAAYCSLVNRRNKLIHFKSSHDTIKSEDVELNGLANTSVFAAIKAETPIEVLGQVRGVVELVAESQSLSEHEKAVFLQSWLGLF